MEAEALAALKARDAHIRRLEALLLTGDAEAQALRTEVERMHGLQADWQAMLDDCRHLRQHCADLEATHSALTEEAAKWQAQAEESARARDEQAEHYEDEVMRWRTTAESLEQQHRQLVEQTRASVAQLSQRHEAKASLLQRALVAAQEELRTLHEAEIAQRQGQTPSPSPAPQSPPPPLLATVVTSVSTAEAATQTSLSPHGVPGPCCQCAERVRAAAQTSREQVRDLEQWVKEQLQRHAEELHRRPSLDKRLASSSGAAAHRRRRPAATGKATVTLLPGQPPWLDELARKCLLASQETTTHASTQRTEAHLSQWLASLSTPAYDPVYSSGAAAGSVDVRDVVTAATEAARQTLEALFPQTSPGFDDGMGGSLVGLLKAFVVELLTERAGQLARVDLLDAKLAQESDRLRAWQEATTSLHAARMARITVLEASLQGLGELLKEAVHSPGVEQGRTRGLQHWVTRALWLASDILQSEAELQQSMHTNTGEAGSGGGNSIGAERDVGAAFEGLHAHWAALATATTATAACATRGTQTRRHDTELAQAQADRLSQSAVDAKAAAAKAEQQLATLTEKLAVRTRERDSKDALVTSLRDKAEKLEARAAELEESLKRVEAKSSATKRRLDLTQSRLKAAEPELAAHKEQRGHIEELARELAQAKEAHRSAKLQCSSQRQELKALNERAESDKKALQELEKLRQASEAEVAMLKKHQDTLASALERARHQADAAAIAAQTEIDSCRAAEARAREEAEMLRSRLAPLEGHERVDPVEADAGQRPEADSRPDNGHLRQVQAMLGISDSELDAIMG